MNIIKVIMTTEKYLLSVVYAGGNRETSEVRHTMMAARWLQPNVNTGLGARSLDV